MSIRVFHSTPIKRYSCVVPYQTAFEIVGELICTGYIEIETTPEEDTKNSFFIVLSRIRALRMKLEKLLEAIEGEYGIGVRRITYDEKKVLIAKMRVKLSEKRLEALKYLDSEEEKIERKLVQIDTMANNYHKLKGMMVANLQEADIVKAKLELFGRDSPTREFSLLTGICTLSQRPLLERFIFRASRGHSYVVFKERNSELEPESCIMIAFISGDTKSLLFNKIIKFCQCSNIILYELPNSTTNLDKYFTQLENKKHELANLLSLSQKTLLQAVQYYTVKEDKPRIIKKITKLAYLQRVAFILCHQQPTGSSTHFLLCFHKPTQQPLPIPTLSFYESQQSQYTPRTCLPQLPCLYEANLLTQLFSVPAHNQINPSAIMFITLPILFGIMYSDIGHGIMILTIAVGLELGPIWWLMGVMSVYCGVVFNQFFGMKVGLAWEISKGTVGVDPNWGTATNALAFENSLKMKISIVVGAVHMLSGLLLRIYNQIYTKKKLNVLYDSIPKLVIFCCTIGYMVFLIIFKWTINWTGKQSIAPSIISMILEMYLGYHETRKHSLFSSVQKEKQVAHYLKLICCVCLFLIMFGKGIHHWLSSPSRTYSRLQQSDQQQQMHLPPAKQVVAQQPQHFGPLQAFQYILSLISSITSYLRLFALSLSHQKLSHLLLDFLLSTLGSTTPYISLLRSMVFFTVTVLMMVLLDVMECVMHVIRLHWVEWMGKFFKGGGVKFKPEKVAVE